MTSLRDIGLRDKVAREGIAIVHFDKPLLPAQQVEFSLTFGAGLHLMPRRLQFTTDPAVLVVSNRRGHGDYCNGQYWHSDGAYMPEPDRTAFSMHHMVRPTEDGNTLYCDLERAFRALKPEDRIRLQGLYCISTRTRQAHSILNRHPQTGKPTLYVNFEAGSYVGDRSGNRYDRIGKRLHNFLTRHAYRHRWREGDMIVTDSFRVAHCACPAAQEHLRILHRTTVPGRSAWWLA